MLIPFASCFRRQPSGTGNNGLPTSLSTLRRNLASGSQAANRRPAR